MAWMSSRGSLDKKERNSYAMTSGPSSSLELLGSPYGFSRVAWVLSLMAVLVLTPVLQLQEHKT